MFALPSPEHVQLLSTRHLEAACHADDASSPPPSDDDRALARLARAERARRLGDFPAARDRTATASARLNLPRAHA